MSAIKPHNLKKKSQILIEGFEIGAKITDEVLYYYVFFQTILCLQCLTLAISSNIQGEGLLVYVNLINWGEKI